jgi:hypothetical protein
MINHPLLQPKRDAPSTRVANYAQELTSREPEVLRENPSPFQKRWVWVLATYGLIAILAFMLVPVVTLTFGDFTTNFIENLKDLVNFGAPTLLLVAILVGVTGYYGYARIAWWLSFGFWVSIIVLIINISTGVNWLNFGIFWIIIGTLVGLFIGSAFELVNVFRHRRERFLILLLCVGMLATLAALVIAIQNGTKPPATIVSLPQAQTQLSFRLFEPKKIPSRYVYYEPKYFVLNGEFHIYYGDDNYPPPPVIDFLRGLEVIQSSNVGLLPSDDLQTAVSVMIDGAKAQYHEMRGRSILEWSQDQTNIIVISHSPMNGKEFLEFARSFVPVTP